MNGPIEFDEEWYLERYPDVARAVQAGSYASGLQQYLKRGGREGRVAPPEFNAGSSEARLAVNTLAETSWPLTSPLQEAYNHCQRRFLERFGDFDPAIGLSSILRGLETVQADPRIAYSNVLGRWPSAYEYQSASGDAVQTYSELLASAEFQDTFIASVLNAYPEKRRLLFVHIPKCAGTDLQAVLSDRAAAIHKNITLPNWTSMAAFYGHLKSLVLQLPRSPNILVCGHNRLQWFITQKLQRMGDRLFAVVREPVSRALSQINYSVAALIHDPIGSRPDTRRWLDMLGRSEIDPSDPRGLATEMLERAPDIMGGNVMCQFLGRGDFESTISSVRSCNIELSETDCYDEWLATRWDSPQSKNANRSRPLVTKGDLSSTDLDRIRTVAADDFRLYERIRSRLKASGKSFVYGYDL